MEKSNISNIVTIMGSPSSGKTTMSIKLASTLAGRKKSAIIVSLDSHCPAIPYVLPSNIMQKVTLGDIFKYDKVSRGMINDACIPIPDHEFLQIIGYGLGESPTPVSMEIFTDFLSEIQPLADYIILDCTSNLDDVLTRTAIQLGDVVFQLGSANTKGLTYYANADPLYNQKDVGIFVVGDHRHQQDVDAISKAYGGARYVLPNCEEIERQLLEVTLFSPLKSKESRAFKQVFVDILADVFDIFPEKRIIYKKQSMLQKITRWILHGDGKGEF